MSTDFFHPTPTNLRYRLPIEIHRPPWQTLPRGARLNPNPLNIMIDIDEVLIPLVDSIHQIAYERGLHDGSRPHEMWEGWRQYGCSPDVYWDLWSDFALGGGYLSTAPFPEAVEAVRKLYWEGHNIHLVTARGFMKRATEIRAWTQEWIEEFAIPHHSLVFSKDKPAAQQALGVRFDYAFDDSPRNYEALLADGVKVYLIDHPHNANYSADWRLTSLAEGVEMILEETR